MIEFNDADIDNELTSSEGGASWFTDGVNKEKGYSVFVRDIEVLFSESEIKAMLKAIGELP